MTTTTTTTTTTKSDDFLKGNWAAFPIFWWRNLILLGISTTNSLFWWVWRFKLHETTLGKMGGVTPCVEIQICLCTVCISAWPPICPLATSPCLSVLSICWVQYVVPGERCGCCSDARPKGLSTATSLITNAMWTGHAMHDHNQNNFRDWLLQAVWLGSEWGKNLEFREKQGHTQKHKKISRMDLAMHVALRQRQLQKAQISANTLFKNPQNAGPEFWGAGKGKGEFGSGSWWGL